MERYTGGTFTSNRASAGAAHVQYTGHVDEISGGSFNNDNGYGMVIFTAGDSDKYPRVDKISGGIFTANYGIFLKSYAAKADGSPAASIGEISGGSFIGKSTGIQVDTFAGIERISNGTIIGGKHAVMNSTGRIDKITGGVFYGKTGNAYKNTGANVTRMEPDLSVSIGNARYWGKKDAISQVNGNVTYPNGYHMSSKTKTLPVDGIEDTQFRYLKKFLTLSYDGNGGTGNMDSLTETTDGEEFTIKKNQFQKEGISFVEWNTKADGSGVSYHEGDKLTLSEDTTLYAQWKSVQHTVTFMNDDTTCASVRVETGKSIDEDNLTSQCQIIQKKQDTPSKSGILNRMAQGQSLRETV